MNYKRKFEQSKAPKVPRHCGKPMLYKESADAWICVHCGKIKHKPKDSEVKERREQ